MKSMPKAVPQPSPADLDEEAEEKETVGRIKKKNAKSKRPGKQVKDPEGLAKQIHKFKAKQKGC